MATRTLDEPPDLNFMKAPLFDTQTMDGFPFYAGVYEARAPLFYAETMGGSSGYLEMDHQYESPSQGWASAPPIAHQDEMAPTNDNTVMPYTNLETINPAPYANG